MEKNIFRMDSEFSQTSGEVRMITITEARCRNVFRWKQSSKDFKVTEVNAVKENDHALLNATYLLPAGNLYKIQYKIYPDGVMKVNAEFTSTSMEANNVEASEATQMATFTPEMKSRENSSKLEVPRIECVSDCPSL